jgi:hypothetical protein
MFAHLSVKFFATTALGSILAIAAAVCLTAFVWKLVRDSERRLQLKRQKENVIDHLADREPIAVLRTARRPFSITGGP